MKFLKFGRMALIGIAAMTLCACGGSGEGGSSSSSQGGSSNNSTWTVTCDYNYVGAPAAKTLTVANGGMVTVESPTRDSYVFSGWWKDAVCVIQFNTISDKIYADTTIYAGWIAGGSSSSSSEGSSEGSSESSSGSEGSSQSSSESSSSSSIANPSEWYVVGAGSFVTSEWSTAGGVNLDTNTSSADINATGEYFNTITFAAGDLWKITNGTVWVQMNCLEKTDNAVMTAAAMEEKEDGSGNTNVKVNTAGAYTIYFKTYESANSEGTSGYSIWLEFAA